jgi:phosphate/phosphite/phosphonate ABC transporter binding protein
MANDLLETWCLTRLNRRKLVGVLSSVALLSSRGQAAVNSPIQFGLTPVFLTSDIELLTRLKSYLTRKCGTEVELVQRRTYEEITGLLLSGQLDAAWICGYPFAQYRSELALVAVPEWRGKPLYQSYIIVRAERSEASIEDLKDDLHAFSDPNSNSGYLVTAALLAEHNQKPETFFKKTIFTYGHRNVVRAVASGLAQSGSVDGYVWEVMAELEPELTGKTRILRKSEELGFPPIACLRNNRDSPQIAVLRQALLDMANDSEGREVLNLLKLDGFAEEPESLFDLIAAKMNLVRSGKT